MNWTYKVLTQHKTMSGEFICGLEIEADSPEGAAHKRFEMQNERSQRNTTAILVLDGDEAYVFSVVTQCVIADAPLKIGAST